MPNPFMDIVFFRCRHFALRANQIAAYDHTIFDPVNKVKENPVPIIQRPTLFMHKETMVYELSYEYKGY